MKREEIEQAVTRLGGIDYFKKDIVAFAIEQVNAALEEAEQYGRRWEHSNCHVHENDPCCHTRSYISYADAIRALKIK